MEEDLMIRKVLHSSLLTTRGLDSGRKEEEVGRRVICE